MLRIPPDEERSRYGSKFQTLKALELVPPNLKHPPRPLWMSPSSTRLIEKRAALLRNPRHIQNMARGIMRAVCQSLMVDSRRRAEETATEIGEYLEPTTVGAGTCRA